MKAIIGPVSFLGWPSGRQFRSGSRPIQLPLLAPAAPCH
jgi:hypothetical protein